MSKINKFLNNRELFWKDFHAKRADKGSHKKVLKPEEDGKLEKEVKPKKVVKSKKETINYMGKITLDGAKLNKVESDSPQKMKVCFVADKNNDLLSDILDITSLFTDFRYLHKNNIFFIETAFEEDVYNENLRELVSRIVTKTDRENKTLFGLSRYYFVFDPLPGVVESIRFCNPDIYIVAVVTKTKIFDKLSLENFDCLLIKENLPQGFAINSIRKIEHFKFLSDIPFLMRKIVQEIHSRDYEVLLPLIGFDGFHQKELMDFDTKKFDGLIKIKKRFKYSSYKNSSEQYPEFIKNITDLAVTEQTFYAYSNLLNSKRGVDLGHFINFSLTDGKRYYVTN